MDHAFAAGLLPHRLDVDVVDQARPALGRAVAEDERLSWRYVDPGGELQRLRRCVEGRRHAAIGPGNPAAVDHYPTVAELVMKGLQQLYANLAVTGAAVEQEAVLGIEATLQMHAGKGRLGAAFDLLR